MHLYSGNALSTVGVSYHLISNLYSGNALSTVGVSYHLISNLYPGNALPTVGVSYHLISSVNVTSSLFQYSGMVFPSAVGLGS